MPRQPRLVIPGYPHHVILRGNNKNAIFNSDNDRRFFINCIREAKEKTISKIYSYCLMTNHVHLIIAPSVENGLGNLIQSLGRKYVQYFNWAYKRTGTLWEGRFKSSLISNDKYLIACSIYIELNPVRANIVKKPGNYPWSSYSAKAEGAKDPLIEMDPIYMDLGKREEDRQLKYKELVKDVSPDTVNLIRDATQKGGIIGGERFVDKISGLVGRDVILRQRGRPRKSL
ncbi:MAG: transposase [Candidatus Omnitrophica bacterium]|nr:transposase [Candidatus Omnitrophota bacterium]